MEDMVNHPKHYEDGCSIECIHMMWTVIGLKGVIMFCLGNAYKYLWRHKLKNNPEKDLAKAKWYIDEAFGMMGDLCDEDRDTYKILFPRLCELLRVYNLYFAKNRLNVNIEIEDSDDDIDEDDFLNFLKQRDKEAEDAIKEQHKREDEDRKDWKKVYDYLNSYPTIDNGYPNDPITSAFKICQKHRERDS